MDEVIHPVNLRTTQKSSEFRPNSSGSLVLHTLSLLLGRLCFSPLSLKNFRSESLARMLSTSALTWASCSLAIALDRLSGFQFSLSYIRLGLELGGWTVCGCRGEGGGREVGVGLWRGVELAWCGHCVDGEIGG